MARNFSSCFEVARRNIFETRRDISRLDGITSVTDCPGYRESCHRRPSLIKWSLTTIVLRLMEIRYYSIVAKVHSKLRHITAFLNIKCKEYQNLETKCVTTSRGLPYVVLYQCISSRFAIYFFEFELKVGFCIWVTLCLHQIYW